MLYVSLVERLELNRQQRNDLSATIVHHGIDPSEFKWQPRGSRIFPELIVTALIHLPTGSYFLLDRSSNLRQIYVAEFSPGANSNVDRNQCHDVLEVVDWGFRWVELLRRDLDTPDLWAEVSKRKELFERATAQGADNTPFTQDEV